MSKKNTLKNITLAYNFSPETLNIDIDKILNASKSPKKHISVGIIGTAGHVDHGKSTVTESLTGKFPATHSEEILRGITIYLGYSHLDIYACMKDDTLSSITSNASKKCPSGSSLHHIRCYSILDHPGHEILISTMLSGASIIDFGIVVIAANEPCPMPQTREHVAALEVMGVNKIICVQNKIELVPKEKLLENYRQIVNFFKNETSYDVPPIIPVSAALKINTELILAAILQYFPPQQPNTSGPAIMYIARSFDPNRPGTSIKNLGGGVIGGALKSGELKIGDEIEIRPGVITKSGEIVSLYSEIVSIRTDAGQKINKAQPHMLIGIGTNLDPSIAKSDGLVGNIAGKPQDLPPVVKKVIVKKINMFEKVIGSRTERLNVPLRRSETILINVGTNTTLAQVDSIDGDEAEIILEHPISIPKGERVALLREIDREFRLVGYGLLDY
ncbi:MAG: translation initiation factor IF-2 subunit gamma [Candidatus Njordarchaeota archaeon]